MLAALGPWALGRPLRQTSEQDFTEDDGTWTYTYTIHAASDCSDAASATLDQFTNPDGTTLFGHCAYRSDPFADPSPLVATNSSMIYKCKEISPDSNTMVIQYYAGCDNCFCEVDDSYEIERNQCKSGVAVGIGTTGSPLYLKLTHLMCGGDEPDPCFGRDTAHACRLRDTGAAADVAFDACFSGAGDAAERVLMRELVAGDRVLTQVAGAPTVTRVLLTEHRADDDTAAPVVTLHHAGGALTLTPDHVLQIDGAFAPARTARTGSVLTGARGEPLAVTHVQHALEGIVNPITLAGTILAAGPAGAPVLASVYGEWIAEWLLAATVWPLPYSLASSAAFVMPSTVQAYHDQWVEPAFLRAAKQLKTVKASVPSPVVALIVAAFDLLLTAGVGVFCIASHPMTAGAAAFLALAARRRGAKLA